MGKPERIAIVVQRCHPKALGGAEALAWQYANLLKQKFRVDVLTTRAIEAGRWQEEIPPGWREEAGIHICHFPNWEGHSRYWDRLHRMLLDAWRRHCQNPELRTDGNPDNHLVPLADSLQREWVRFQGPHSPGLLDYLQRQHSLYKKILFVTYLYSPSAFGLPLVPKQKSLFVPALHDEPPAWMPVYRDVALQAGKILWNTRAERHFGQLLWGELPGEIVSMGIDLKCLDGLQKKIAEKNIIMESASDATQTFSERIKMTKTDSPPPYLLNLGRIDAGKGCAELIEFMNYYNSKSHERVRLFFAGVLQMKLPRHFWIRYLGFVSEEEKVALLSNAQALVMPSANESLSLVTLEAMALRCPVLVTKKSEVLMEHIREAQSGRSYRDAEGFATALQEILSGIPDEELERGRRHVERNYDISVVQKKLCRLIEEG